MASGVVVELPRDRALRASFAAVLDAVDRNRILPADVRAAAVWAGRLAADVSASTLCADEAEQLLAVCDAVWLALDARRLAPAVAAAVETFGTLRALVYVACSAPREVAA